MMSLDAQIRAALRGEDDQHYEDPTITKTAAARTEHVAVGVGEHEKIATALEFIAHRGLANMIKEASAPATNASASYGEHQQKTTAPHKAAPPMSPKAVGEADHDLHQRPGGSGEQYKPGGTGQTHHSALSSSAAAINFDKREKAKIVSADLNALFDAKPFADGKLKENLSSAAGKGDKNIHVKTASDRELLRQALAEKIAARQRG